MIDESKNCASPQLCELLDKFPRDGDDTVIMRWLIEKDIYTCENLQDNIKKCIQEKKNNLERISELTLEEEMKELEREIEGEKKIENKNKLGGSKKKRKSQKSRVKTKRKMKHKYGVGTKKLVYLEYNKGTSKKFWQGELSKDKKYIFIKYGRIGTKGRNITKKVGNYTPKNAQTIFQGLVESKISKGYIMKHKIIYDH